MEEMEISGGVPGAKRFYLQKGVAMTCRSFKEYADMFGLEEDLLRGRAVLDVSGGASSFTADAYRAGADACAADPLYGLDAEEMSRKGLDEIEVSSAKIAGNSEVFDWSYYGSPERHRAIREESFVKFMDDYTSPSGKGIRYRQALLPNLPWEDRSFDLVLCSHFLFLYKDQFDEAFHLDALTELLRVCRPGGEVRVYPLLGFDGRIYEGLDGLTARLKERGVSVDFPESRLPFIPDSTSLLRLVKSDSE